MININDPKECCGCTACASICSHDAISMEPDSLGFLYPKVDESKCVECGLCEKVCQFNDHYDTSLNFPEPIAYAARHKDIDEVMKSRSGAAFVAISDYIIEQGGVVYGAGYKDHFRVAHKRATTKEERDEFRGSKYVQSDLTGIFKQVKEDLKNGLTVLFSGTPCQTSGLNSYVGKKLREKLFLVDIVCHGVPSPFIWQDYINYLERKHGRLIQNFEKKGKWSYNYVKMCSRWETWYTVLFYQHMMFRHSCGNCYFCNTRRPSDITLADFWGWMKNVPGMNDDDKGISLILINTEKGKEMFDTIQTKLDVKEVDLDNCLQPNLQHPSLIHPKRMQFEKDYIAKGFDYIYYKDYALQPIWVRLRSKCKKFIKSIIRK